MAYKCTLIMLVRSFEKHPQERKICTIKNNEDIRN